MLKLPLLSNIGSHTLYIVHPIGLWSKLVHYVGNCIPFGMQSLSHFSESSPHRLNYQINLLVVWQSNIAPAVMGWCIDDRKNNGMCVLPYPRDPASLPLAIIRDWFIILQPHVVLLRCSCSLLGRLGVWPWQHALGRSRGYTTFGKKLIQYHLSP